MPSGAYFKHLVTTRLWVKPTLRKAEMKDTKSLDAWITVDPLNQPALKPALPRSFQLQPVRSDLLFKPVGCAISVTYTQKCPNDDSSDTTYKSLVTVKPGTLVMTQQLALIIDAIRIIIIITS